MLAVALCWYIQSSVVKIKQHEYSFHTLTLRTDCVNGNAHKRFIKLMTVFVSVINVEKPPRRDNID